MIGQSVTPHSAGVVSRCRVGVIAGMLVLGAALSQPAAEAESADVVQPCRDAWGDAPASDYCTSTSIARAVTGTSLGNCIIEVSSCSITVSVDDEDETFTPTWPSGYTSSGDGVSVGDADTIDICFSGSNGSYTATVKAGCDSEETGSASASSDGLD